MTVTPQRSAARLDVLVDGYVGDRVGSTVTLVRDGDAVVVVDPGLVRSREAILDPMRALGVAVEDVTDVVFSHHHPDHTLNAALFPAARFHDHWAIYRDDTWDSRPAEGFVISPSVVLLETPGHSPQDITTLVGTPDGVIACTHLWWHADGPADDPYAPVPALLHQHRARVLEVAQRIVPGHGPSFTPGPETPR
jgi:glyoxylase-like metal-dependent hydrolase (beta-lactamase superfamily II)